MTPEELADALDGLMAYDTGSVDSGIHDEALRRRVIDYLHGLGFGSDEWRLVLSRYLREQMLTEERLAEGYGIEDVHECLEWLRDVMEVPL